MAKRQVGTIPYLKVNGKVKLVLVTSRSSGKWIFPKGNLEPNMSKRRVAAMEAYEEAGLRGTIPRGKSTVVPIRRRGCRIDLQLFPMNVRSVLPKWPEQKQRKRIIVSPQKAAALLDDEAVSRCIEDLSKII